MPLNVNDVIRFTSRSSFLGQETDNVFFYLVEAIDATGNLALATIDFYQKWTTVIRVVQSSGLIHYGLDAANLTTGEKFAYRPATPILGAVTSTDDSQSFVAFSIALLGETSITRQGGKRIGGVTEGNINGNEVATISGAVKLAIVTFMVGDVVTPEGTLAPQILGRNNVGEYDFTRLNPIANAQFEDDVTTQNSRKKGKGI